MIVISYEHRCDQLHFSATIQAINRCNMASPIASFENIRGNESKPYASDSESHTSSCFEITNMHVHDTIIITLGP
jgi:hypothetical protein